MGLQKRKKKIIKPRFQLRVFGVLVLFIVAIWVITILGLYSYSVRTISEIKGEEIIVRNFLNTISIYAFLSLIIVLLVGYFISIHLSHKIAGPIYRLEQVLKQMGNNTIPRACNVRNSDLEEFKYLAKLLDDYIQNFKVFYTHSKNLSIILDKIVADDVVDENEMKIMHNELKKFEQYLDQYKIEESVEE